MHWVRISYIFYLFRNMYFTYWFLSLRKFSLGNVVYTVTVWDSIWRSNLAVMTEHIAGAQWPQVAVSGYHTGQCGSRQLSAPLRSSSDNYKTPNLTSFLFFVVIIKGWKLKTLNSQLCSMKAKSRLSATFVPCWNNDAICGAIE